MEKVDRAIEKANQKLTRITIDRRGGKKLSLRGTLPKKSGEGRGNKQRYIPLGLEANPDGVEFALAKAQKLESDLRYEKFQWADWEKGRSTPGEKTAADWGKEFGVIKAGTIQPDSYSANYEEPLSSLPAKRLTEELLVAHILSRSEPNSWGRKNDCMVFKQVAREAGISVDFSKIRGRYKPKPVNKDDLPTDEKIEAIWNSIQNPAWKWVYGMMATYGLRPHEVFKIIDYTQISSPTGKIRTRKDTKTGTRDIWPLPDKWRFEFNLSEVIFPNIELEGRNNKQIGERVSANLCGQKNRKIPHHPYVLRHAWAIRSAVMGVPDSIASKWMGHSVAIHAGTYHEAIDQLHHEAIWKRANQLGNSI